MGISALAYFPTATQATTPIPTVSVKDYGARGDGKTDDTAACQSALDSGALEIIFPPGVYKIGDLRVSRSLTITNQGEILGRISVRDTTPDINLTPGKGSIENGQKILHFTKPHPFSPGENIVISLMGAGDSRKNQAGLHFSKILDASSQMIELERPVRFDYNRFSCATFTGSTISHSIDRGTSYVDLAEEIPITPGTLIRIECLEGSDSPYASWNMGPLFARNSYFEINVVKKIEGKRVYLEANTAYAYKTALLISLGKLNNITLRGGKINDIRATNTQNLTLTNITTNRIQLSRCFNFSVSEIDISAKNTPIGFGLSACRRGRISKIDACCATGSTDNGNVKIMSGLDITIENVRSSQTSAKAQGIYPMFVDFYVTPYSSWSQNITIANCQLGAPNGGAQRSLWIAGGRECTVSRVKVDAGVRVEKSVDITIDNLEALGLLDFQEVRDLKKLANFTGRGISLAGVERAQISDGNIIGCSTNIPVRIGRSKVVSASSDVTLERVKFDAQCKHQHLQSEEVERLKLIDVLTSDGQKIKIQQKKKR
ncbi:hypothetical protein GCM10009097_59130 [Pigmentiphaga daeguensis]|uniref:Rhamnogalacturonase A/B/Epimerase-like pectate lyase domain-containing protein n=2 Tax=Pigmentiphaga daeguensis TaxID=414049 RepID=A0ABP3N2S8_9BURK